MQDCIKCGNDAIPGTKLCESHTNGYEKRQPTKHAQLKAEARYLRGQIKKAKATLRMRDKVTDMRAQLSNLQENIEHPERFPLGIHS